MPHNNLGNHGRAAARLIPASAYALLSFLWSEQARAEAIVMPAGFHPEHVALIANGSLKINDRAQVHAYNGGYAPIFNRGSSTEIGTDARVGTIISGGGIFLRDRASVYGDVLSVFPPNYQNANTLSPPQLNLWVSQSGSGRLPRA